MKKILWLVGLIIATWLLAGCDAGATTGDDGAYIEDMASYDANVDDDAVEANESPPPDVVYNDTPDEPACPPPLWPEGTEVHCTHFVVDYCVISWDMQECTASCLDPDDNSFLFRGAQPEAVPIQPPQGLGCSPI